MLNRRMKIGIDIDEVLAEFMPPFLEFYEQLSGRKIKFEEIRSYNLWESGIGRDREEAMKLVNQFHSSENFDKIPIVAGAKKAINELLKEADISIVTARHIKFKQKTEIYLAKNFLDVKLKVIYTGDFYREQGRTKAQICEEELFNEFYEDNLRYAMECSFYARRVFLFNKPWNQERVNGNIIRVHSWQEAMMARKT